LNICIEIYRYNYDCRPQITENIPSDSVSAAATEIKKLHIEKWKSYLAFL